MKNRTIPSLTLFLVFSLLSFYGAGIQTAMGAASDAYPLWGNLKQGPHQVGFKQIVELDRSRSYYPKYDYEQQPHKGERARPIRIYIWYPAEKSDVLPMFFAKYFDLALNDFGPRSDTDKKNLWSEIPLVHGLSEQNLDVLFNTQTAAMQAAKSERGEFPLIVFGQGLYYESPITHCILCEYLASHGYVVATCPLLGTYSRLVELDVIDLETQVRDMEFVISAMRRGEFVDSNKLGLIGFDLGGMSSLVLAMRNTDIDAFASLDAGILFSHPSGLPRTSPHYNADSFRIPWMHMTRREAVENSPQNEDIRYLFEAKKYGDSYLLLFDDTQHVDFTSYSMFGIEKPVPAYWGPERSQSKSRYTIICQYVKNFFNAFLLDDQKGMKFINRNPDIFKDEGVSFTIEKNIGAKAPPVFDDFVRQIFENGLEDAIRLYRQTKENHPGSELFDEAKMNRLGYQFLYFWGNPGHAIELFKLNIEGHSESFNVYDSLGEAYMLNGQTELAIKNYEKSLELNPENSNAVEMLKRLREDN